MDMGGRNVSKQNTFGLRGLYIFLKPTRQRSDNGKRSQFTFWVEGLHRQQSLALFPYSERRSEMTAGAET